MAQMVIHKMLTSKGAAVTLVENGQLAVDAFESAAGKCALLNRFEAYLLTPAAR